MSAPGDTPAPHEIRDVVDHAAITRLLSAYADVVNRRAWRDLAGLFRPDALVRVDTVTNPVITCKGPEALGDFIGGAIERFSFFEFIVLNAHVELRHGGDPDAARARVFMCEVRQDHGTGEFTRAFGLYRDEFHRVDGRWWFARRDYQSLARSGGAVFLLPDDAR